MIRKTTEFKIAQAYTLLVNRGFCIHVPCCYDVLNVSDAVLYAKDRNAFYRKMEEED